MCSDGRRCYDTQHDTGTIAFNDVDLIDVHTAIMDNPASHA
ncbi:MAG: hypothetical protein R3D29_12225 [Nitratireductor sp.]